MNKLNLTQEMFLPYYGGQVKITSDFNSYFQGEIKSISFEEAGKDKDDKLKIQLLWAAQFPNKAKEIKSGINLSNLKKYVVDLKTFVFPDYGESDKKSIRIYSPEKKEEIIFYLANSRFIIDPLILIRDVPSSMEAEIAYAKLFFLQKLDLKKIPTIDFDIGDITLFRDTRFVRIDLAWQNEIWPFIRISKNLETLHSKIYFLFLDEIAEQFSITKEDIKDLVWGDGGGFLWRNEDDDLLVLGPNGAYVEEEDRNLTKNLLREKLKVNVD